MSKPSANSCRRQYYLNKTTIFRVDSLFFSIHPSFENAYARYFAIGKNSVCVVCLSICPSITSNGKQGKNGYIRKNR